MSAWELMFRRRALSGESYEAIHQRFIEKIRPLDPPWNLQGREKVPDMGRGILTTVRLSKHLGRGLNGYILYNYRGKNYPDPKEDIGQNDDHISIEFSPKNVSYDYIARYVFPCYAVAFQCYRAAIYNMEMQLADNPRIFDPKTRTGWPKRRINIRSEVLRINAVNYYDRELCRRAFQLSPEEIVNRLSGKAEDVRLLGDGVLLVYTYRFLESQELAHVDAEVRNILRIKPLL